MTNPTHGAGRPRPPPPTLQLLRALEFHALITNGGVPRECCYPLKGIGFLPCGGAGRGRAP